MVGDVREGGQREREGGADLGAQVADVGLRRGVAAFVLGLGVDHEAVRAVRDRLGAERGLAGGVRPVDVLPGAHFQAGGMERLDEFGGELAPVVAGAVRALDEHGRDAGGVRLRDDRRQRAAAGSAHVPDPHALAFERAGADPTRRDGRGRLGDRWMQCVGVDVDRAVGAGVAAPAEQDLDVAGVGRLRNRGHEPERGLAQPRCGGPRVDRGARLLREADHHPRLQPDALDEHGAVGRDLAWVGGAVRGRRAGDARDAHGRDVGAAAAVSRAARFGLAARGRGAARGRERRQRAAQEGQRDRTQRSRRRGHSSPRASFRRDHETLPLVGHGRVGSSSDSQPPAPGVEPKLPALRLQTSRRHGSCAAPSPRGSRSHAARAPAGCTAAPPAAGAG